MRLPKAYWLGLVSILLSMPLLADDHPSDGRAAIKTAKERLVNKAADAQRLNDCKVPPEQRDADHPKPDDCRHITEAERIRTPGTNR